MKKEELEVEYIDESEVIQMINDCIKKDGELFAYNLIHNEFAAHIKNLNCMDNEVVHVQDTEVFTIQGHEIIKVYYHTTELRKL